MRFNYEEHSLKSGIYKILNTHTNRIYVGQCSSFKKRWYQHSQSLKTNKHQNKFLLNDFRKCREELGHDDFLEFHVLEVMEGSTKKQRSKREEELIAQWFDGGKQCYNLISRAVSREDCPSKNPEETRKKLSASSKAKWSNPEFKDATRKAIQAGTMKPKSRKLRSDVMKTVWENPEHRKKVVAHRQRPELKEAFKLNCPSDIAVKKSIEARRKLYGKLCSPTGETYEVWSLTEFCQVHGLGSQNIGNIGKLFKGLYQQVSGWTLAKEQ